MRVVQLLSADRGHRPRPVAAARVPTTAAAVVAAAAAAALEDICKDDKNQERKTTIKGPKYCTKRSRSRSSAKPYGGIQVASRSRDIVNTGLEPCVPFPTLAMTVAYRAHGGGTVLIGSAAGTISLSSTLYAGKVEVVPSMEWTCPQLNVASQNGAGETADCSIMVAHQFNDGGIRVKPCHQRLISQKHATITQLESLYCCGRRQQYIVKKQFGALWIIKQRAAIDSYLELPSPSMFKADCPRSKGRISVNGKRQTYRR
jgi:hypothetical protein